jgi:cell division protein FtsZ
MTLNLTIPQQMHTDFSPRITVIGVGGGGTNAVDNMIAMNLQGVEFVVANTDAQQLQQSRADRRIQLGPHLTQGLGAGAKPTVGRAAAEEASDELDRHLDGAHMVFITAGMGGGTGTGAAPVIARMARERNILTVGVVTKPFTFEGGKRARAADEGILELQQYVDTLIVIPNQNLFRLANERTGFKEAFKMADNVLYMGVRGVTDLMMAPGLVNLDFADIRAVMAEMGKAMMGTGEADGENRAIRAAEAAISNPLLEDTSMAGARGLLINITGGDDMTLFEVDQAANRIREEVDEDANIIFGAATDDSLSGRIRVSVVATGIESALPQQQEERPRLVAVGGGGVQAISSHSVPGQSVPQAEAPATAPLSVVSTPSGASQSTGLRGPVGMPARMPQAPHGGIQSTPMQRPHVVPPQAPPQAAPQHHQSAPQTYATPQQDIGGEHAAPHPDAPQHGMAQHAAPQQPIPVIDDTPAPRRPIPEHLRQPVGGANARARTSARPASGGLFADPPTQAAPRRSSLFGIVTGVFRGAPAAGTEAVPAPIAQPVAAAPQPVQEYQQESPAVQPQAPSNGERELDIPTFLRRQTSHPNPSDAPQKFVDRQ